VFEGAAPGAKGSNPFARTVVGGDESGGVLRRAPAGPVESPVRLNRSTSTSQRARERSARKAKAARHGS